MGEGKEMWRRGRRRGGGEGDVGEGRETWGWGARNKGREGRGRITKSNMCKTDCLGGLTCQIFQEIPQVLKQCHS